MCVCECAVGGGLPPPPLQQIQGFNLIQLKSDIIYLERAIESRGRTSILKSLSTLWILRVCNPLTLCASNQRTQEERFLLGTA